MSDLLWMQFVAQILTDLGVTDEADRLVLIDKIRRRDDYKLAYVQWKGGASDRVVKMLLQRAIGV